MMMFMIGFICGFGSAVAWALTRPEEPEENSKIEKEKEDPFRTY